MNRAERRRKQKEEKINSLNKNQMDFMSKFTPDIRKEIDKAIAEVADMRFEEKTKELVHYVDTCITAAIIENTDLSLDDIKKIQKDSIDLLDENTKKNNALKKQYKEAWILKINQHENDVKKVCKELLEKGVKQKQAVEELVDRFPLLSKALLINAFKRVKEEIKEAEELKKNVVDDEEKKELEEAVEYIFGEQKVEAIETKKEIKGEKEMNIKVSIMEKLNSFTDEKDNVMIKINKLEDEISKLKLEKDSIETKEDKVRQALELLRDIDL